MDYKKMLGEILATIHGDGGHYIEKHGWEKAFEDGVILSAKNKCRQTETSKELYEALKVARRVIYYGEGWPIGWNISRIDEALDKTSGTHD